MKICFLAPASSIHTVRWVNSMYQRGHEIHLITMHPPQEDAIDKGIHMYVLPIKNALGYYLNVFKAKEIIKDIEPDVLNTHYASGYGTLSRFIGFKPTLLSVWGSDVFDFPYESFIKMIIIKKNLKSADRLASTSEIMKTQTESLINPRIPIVVTPFGVDVAKFINKSRKNKETINIGFIKGLEEKYGPEYLLRAISIVKQELNNELAKNIRLIMVGKGSQKEMLVTLAKQLDIEDITEFVGAVPHQDVPGYLNKFDIYCAPSTLDSESFGVAIVEASSCGLPVIASNVGGLPEVVIEGETGYLVKPKCAEDIADKLLTLILDQEKRSVFGEKGRKMVLQKYKWEDNVSVMDNIYKELLH